MCSLLNTNLTKSRIRLKDFKKRMGEEEQVVMTYSFDTMQVRSSTFMNTEIAWDTWIGHIAIFAAKIASELHPLLNAS